MSISNIFNKARKSGGLVSNPRMSVRMNVQDGGETKPITIRGEVSTLEDGAVGIANSLKSAVELTVAAREATAHAVANKSFKVTGVVGSEVFSEVDKTGTIAQETPAAE